MYSKHVFSLASSIREKKLLLTLKQIRSFHVKFPLSDFSWILKTWELKLARFLGNVKVRKKRVPLSPERLSPFPVSLCHCFYHRSFIPSLLLLTPPHLHDDWKLGVTEVEDSMDSATSLYSNNGDEQMAADFSSGFQASWWEPSACNFIWKVFPKGRIKFHIRRRHGIKSSSCTYLENTAYSCEPDC